MKRNLPIILGNLCGMLLPLLLVAATFTGCAKHSSEDTPDPVAIRLYTGIHTRAAVDAFDATLYALPAEPLPGFILLLGTASPRQTRSLSPQYAIIPKMVLRSICVVTILLYRWLPTAH